MTMDYKELAIHLQEFQKAYKHLKDEDYQREYSDWYRFRFCLSHQKKTRADEVWFAKQVNGKIEGTGKKYYEPMKRTVDLGDGYCGSELLVGKNNFDLKVTYQERPEIKAIGFQQYRPSDPVAFYAAMMGVSPMDYTLIIVPSDVAEKMKLDKILKTGKLGSAHGTGIYDQMTTEEKLNVITGAKIGGKSPVLSFSVTKKSNKEDFELLMDNYRMRLEDVSAFILNYVPNK